MAKRLKKDLEKMLATTIEMTIAGEVLWRIPLEAFFHLQNFFKGSIPLDVELRNRQPGMSEFIIPDGIKSKLGGSI